MGDLPVGGQLRTTTLFRCWKLEEEWWKQTSQHMPLYDGLIDESTYPWILIVPSIAMTDNIQILLSFHTLSVAAFGRTGRGKRCECQWPIRSLRLLFLLWISQSCSAPNVPCIHVHRNKLFTPITYGTIDKSSRHNNAAAVFIWKHHATKW